MYIIIIESIISWQQSAMEAWPALALDTANCDKKYKKATIHQWHMQDRQEVDSGGSINIPS